MTTSRDTFGRAYRLASRTFIYPVSLCNRLRLWTPYQPLPEAGLRTTSSRTAKTHDRWAKIEATLPIGPLSVLDVGCNLGFFSLKMAQRGCFVTSLDNVLYSMLLHHIKTVLRLHNITATSLYLDPSNTQCLPRHDCTFLLSVFHHWCIAYGSDAALSMLDEIYDKTTRVMYFETAQPDSAGAKYRSRVPKMEPDPLTWMTSHFKGRGASEVLELAVFRGRHLLAIFK